MSLIDDKYQWLRANSVDLGPPIGPEQASVDGIGRFHVYQFGNIYWHPAIGAFEVHGAILAQYIFMGAEQSTLGYPISDELPLTDGSGGRYSHFNFGIITWTNAAGTTAILNGDPRVCFLTRPLPAGLSIRARDMTRLQARDVVVYLIGQNALSLHANTPLRFDNSCQVVSPAPSTNLVISPPVIDGVRFTDDNGPGATVIDNVDVRTVVALYRLANHLRTTWGVTEIRHKGIGHGVGGSNDCHNTGRALDFSGVRGNLPIGAITGVPGPFDVEVLRDWGNQRVPMPGGATPHDWPVGFTATVYRLNPVTTPIPWALFQDVYTFATQEFADTSDRPGGNGAPTQIGPSSAFIIHPDYRGGERASHQNHMHMQIGPTGLEASPP